VELTSDQSSLFVSIQESSFCSELCFQQIIEPHSHNCFVGELRGCGIADIYGEVKKRKKSDIQTICGQQ